MTYETTKDGGIVEIMTETKSATPTASTGGLSKTSTTNNASAKNGSNTVVVKRNSTPLTTVTTTPTASGVKMISVTSTRAADASNKTDNNNIPPRRRPMPKLIPISGDQQQRRSMPAIIQLKRPLSPHTADNTIIPKVVDNVFSYRVATGQSALSDFASLIDDQYDDQADNKNAVLSTSVAALTVEDRRRNGSGVGSSASPKSKSSSFFDKLKAKVDETADLTCMVCRYESKCLSEFMQHQRTHSDHHDHVNSVCGDDRDQQQYVVINKTKNTALHPPPPLLKVTAAELKSTRCQRCRKRCKTSTELMVHLSTCQGIVPALNNASQLAGLKESDSVNDDGQETHQHHHPMENKIFVWNTSSAPVPMLHGDVNNEERESITITPYEMLTTIKQEPEDNDDVDNGGENEDQHKIFNESATDLLLQKQKQQSSVRKQGKTYKTVSLFFFIEY